VAAPPAKANAAQDDPAVYALAMKMWDQMISGKMDRSLLSPEMNAAMTPELLASVAPQFQPLGKLESLTLLERTSIDGGSRYLYESHFSSGTHKIEIFITADGKVGGYHVTP